MRISKRFTAVLFSVLLVLTLLPTQVLAVGSIDLERNASLTISYQNGKTPLTGAQFNIYLVAAADEQGSLTLTGPFTQFNVNIQGKDDDAWRALASTLEGYVLRDGISPTDSGTTDAKGVVKFPSSGTHLTPGLYLVLGNRHSQGGYYYEASPFMVMLPGFDKEADAWIYDVEANAKYESRKEPDEGSDTLTRKVLKVWKDSGYEEQRPEKIVVQLLRDGEVYDTVALTADNNWRHTWTDLDSNYKWTVVEKELEDYTVEVTREGITFVVSNTYTEDVPDSPDPTEPTPPPTEPDEPTKPGTPTEPSKPTKPGTPTNPSTPDEPKLPQTGQLWWPVPVLTAAGLLLIVAGLLRRRGGKDEE